MQKIYYMLCTTTNTIEGKSIVEYKGIVNGEVIIGANFIKDFFAALRDFFGGRSGSYEAVLQEARQHALAELERAAAAKGANAVVGVDFDYGSIGKGGSMIMVNVSGTAVVVA